MKNNGKDPVILVCGSTTDKDAIMFGAPYYSEEHRGLIAAYDNKFNVLSWKPWLTYDGQASADREAAERGSRRGRNFHPDPGGGVAGRGGVDLW